jgi:NTE family protein
VNVRTDNLVYFDNTKHDIGPEHIMASGSLPPGLPATEIEGEHYWDGGLVSNTPLELVLSGAPRQDTLAFQIDLWSASGRLPGKLIEADERQKDIRFSSRTRAAINQFKRVQLWRRATRHLLEQLPEELRQLPQSKPSRRRGRRKSLQHHQSHLPHQKLRGCVARLRVFQTNVEEHLQSGYNDAVRTLRHPEVLQRPENHEGVFTFDLARDGRE